MKRDYLNEILIDSRHGDLPNIATIERVRLERDALRAEVERLRSALEVAERAEAERDAQALALSDMEREIKILRAALTRARDHLIMSGTKSTDAPEALEQARAALERRP